MQEKVKIYKIQTYSKTPLLFDCLFFIILYFAFSPAALAETRKILILGVLPYLAASNMISSYGAATQALSRQTGLNIHFRTTSNYQKFDEGLTSSRFDLVIVQPFDVEKAVKTLGYIPIAQVSTTLMTVFVTKLESDIKTIKDLKHKTISMAPKVAATTITALEKLHESGFSVGEDLTIRYAKSHDECLHSLIRSEVDACATALPPVKAFEARSNSKLRVFAETAPYPHMAFLVKNNVSETDRNLILNTLLSWNTSQEGQQVLKKMNFSGWKAASYDDYAYLENFHRVMGKSSNHQNDNIIFGAFPYMIPKQLASRLSPIVNALHIAINEAIHFRTSFSYERYRSNLAEQQYDIALIQPYDYALAINYGYEMIARMDDYVSAGFYVKSDSTIKKLDDLRNQIVAFPPSGAAVSILAKNYLAQNGIDIYSDLQPRFRRSHADCMKMLQNENAIACVTAPFIVQTVFPKDLVQNTRIISESGKVPSIAVIAHKRLGTKKIAQIKHTIIGWKQSELGKQILSHARLHPFIPVSESMRTQYQNLKF